MGFGMEKAGRQAFEGEEVHGVGAWESHGSPFVTGKLATLLGAWVWVWFWLLVRFIL